jgi:hypothetical protein
MIQQNTVGSLDEDYLTQASAKLEPFGDEPVSVDHANFCRNFQTPFTAISEPDQSIHEPMK